MHKYQIVNIIANTEVGGELNLFWINSHLDNCEFEPEVYFALIYRLNQPKLTILVNKSGKIIFTGAKSLIDIQNARDVFFNDLFILGYNPKKRNITIQNIVVTTQLDYGIDMLQIIHSNKNGNITYNPKFNHRILLKNDCPKFTVLIFKSGKLVLMGLIDPLLIDVALEITYETFKKWFIDK